MEFPNIDFHNNIISHEYLMQVKPVFEKFCNGEISEKEVAEICYLEEDEIIMVAHLLGMERMCRHPEDQARLTKESVDFLRPYITVKGKKELSSSVKKIKPFTH